MRNNSIENVGTFQQVKNSCLFIADYAAWLCGCGATCIRIEKNVSRIAQAFGLEIEMIIMPSHLSLTGRDMTGEHSFTLVKNIHLSAISFNINTQLSKLSWDIADGRCGFEGAKARFERIKRTRPENKWLTLVLASLANASFCRLFGGDIISMLVVLASTFCGYRLKQIMLEERVDVRLVFVCSSFVSAVLSAGCHLFGWGETPEIALGSSVLYLIPGIPYINSVSDMLDGHYLCAFSRLMNGLVLTTCLSFGLICGLLILNLDLF